MTRVLGAALVIAMGLALAGCGGGTPGSTSTPTPSSSGTSSATPTGSPTPTATPTPEAVVDDPADPATWIVDGNGVGPIHLGADRSGLGSLLPGWSLDPEMVCDNHSYTGPTTMRMLLAGDPVGIVVLVSATPAAVAEGPHTAVGIQLGATTAEVAAAYPALPLVDNGYQSPHYVVPDAGNYVHIILDEGEVRSFFVSPHDSLPMDLC